MTSSRRQNLGRGLQRVGLIFAAIVMGIGSLEAGLIKRGNKIKLRAWKDSQASRLVRVGVVTGYDRGVDSNYFQTLAHHIKASIPGARPHFEHLNARGAHSKEDLIKRIEGIAERSDYLHIRMHGNPHSIVYADRRYVDQGSLPVDIGLKAGDLRQMRGFGCKRVVLDACASGAEIEPAWFRDAPGSVQPHQRLPEALMAAGAHEVVAYRQSVYEQGITDFGMMVSHTAVLKNPVRRILVRDGFEGLKQVDHF